MDGANADSDHSMTWEDFFGSTTDLTPTLIGIYDSLLEPSKSLRPEANRLETAKDARNDPPVQDNQDTMTEEKESVLLASPPKDPSRLAGSIKLPIAAINKSSLYTLRTKSDNNGANETKRDLITDTNKDQVQRTFKETKQDTTFENLSPNVKRMITSAAETTSLKYQKKTITVGRSSTRRCNIPLVGATSKISHSGVEILPSIEIYDQPVGIKTTSNESPAKTIPLIKPEFKINDEPTTYDVPMNNRPAIYDVPNPNKTAFESLSLPFIDQSIELSISSNDREFDTKVSSKDNSPLKPEIKTSTPEVSPVKYPKTVANGTNSLHRKDFGTKNEGSPNKLLKTGPYPEAVASTGNLKMIQEKEVIRLNPPIEVTRPLSMSSIASSSSTSSSGVQNKGGVNSAYLASIESLDDHSDVDVASANGSSNFVNNVGMLKNSVSEESRSEIPRQNAFEEMPGLSQLERVCAEIVQTENVYVEDLRQVVEGYLHVWRRETTFSDDELNELFNNIEDIYAFNKSLCSELNTCQLDATCIARCFVNNTTGFSVYTSYCTGYPRTMERLAALASRPQSAREFRERQVELRHPLPLASYLLKPVQRILKYHLLLQNVVKQCASCETEYALLKMTGIAHHIDDMKRRHEHAVRVQEIQSLLYGWNGPDLTTYGELCAEGTFRVFGAKAMRHAFLFDKMLLVTKNREDGILAYKSHIMCNNMMLVESIAGAPLSFHVIPWDAPRSQLTLQARSPRHKREWTLLLKRVILENYNAVIPSHARQLVMELGQNKTDDDILAEKSHGLITQASMRKQLSAPEYLEKRKLERERRKSFENGIRGRLKKANRKYTINNARDESQECDCVQYSAEKGTDYTCDNCYIDLCSDCETELAKDKNKDDKCSCKKGANDISEKCAECDRALHYIDAGSIEQIERNKSGCKCSDFKSSQESFTKELNCSLNKTRSYHSSDNIASYTESKSKEDLTEINNAANVKNIQKTCLKCAKIKENIPVTDSIGTLHTRKSRCNETEKLRTDTLRSKSKDDPQRSKLSKIGTWRRKSEPGLQNTALITKKTNESDSERTDSKGSEKIEFECRNCGSNKITKKIKSNEGTIISDTELDNRKRGTTNITKPNIEIKMYNTKNIPKKISKIKKNRAKGLRLGSDTTTRFYTDFSTDVSTENILHISESNDSLNVDKPKIQPTLTIPDKISKDEDIDEETYKKLIEKTDSFKKNELEKVKYLNKQKVITEGTEIEDKSQGVAELQEEVQVSCEEIEQPLEQIISQLLMQNREFQKLLKKQQQRNTAQRRHQRLLKSHSNPDQVILVKNELTKLKPKYIRQMSENIELNINEQDDAEPIVQSEIDDASDEDHIYETLRVENRVDNSLHSLCNKSKLIQHNVHVSRPKRLSSPQNSLELVKIRGPESDYVYLSFDQVKRHENLEDGIYDVPVKSPEKVAKTEENTNDYYVTMENQGPAMASNDENIYDNLIEVCRRKKEVPNSLPSDYLPMSPDQQSPNTPEIWLSRQKEHFNVSRDRKSGSLPRSFQVVTSGQDDTNLTTFKCKPNSNSKTYLNRDGKVMSVDRPFTIASDQSEISYDDVETYMSEGDILKFNKNSKSKEDDYTQNISQSTLELEEEIDRCYKNNFEKVDLDTNKNENPLNTSQPNLNVSTTSSCEALTVEQSIEKAKLVEVIHPEHKIYKPTSNVLSLKNVLSRFKSRTPPKHNDDIEINANEHTSDNSKTDLKSPTSEKRSALNPRSYSKNLLQRFRSIIGDEQPDDNQNKAESTKTKSEDSHNISKNEIKVIITSTDNSPTTSTIIYSINTDVLSRSVCDHTTMSESQKEKNNLDMLSQSCENINQKPNYRPNYEKSVSMVTNVTSSLSSTPSPSKSNNSSYQSLNKLPVYMQGSKHLGARIAQSDYVDPTTLMSERNALKNVNVLINKNALRPDSLFSNSSFVTSSSESTYQESQNKISTSQNTFNEKTLASKVNSDESYYEKSFEKIEQLTDVDMFRDSAVYSDQEDIDDGPIESKNKVLNKATTRVESIKRESSFRTKKTVVTTNNSEKKCVKSIVTTTNKINYSESNQNTSKVEKADNVDKSVVKVKIAPPVPVKPKMTTVPTVAVVPSNTIITKNNLSKDQSSSSESVNTRTIKRNTNYKSTFARSESSPAAPKEKTDLGNKMIKSDSQTIETKEVVEDINPQGNIKLKRLSFERASFDSATRKTKTVIENKRTSLEQPSTSKSVLERRLEIEQMTKSHTSKPAQNKKPVQLPKPKSITTKVASFERSVSEIRSKERSINTNVGTLRPNIPSNKNSVSEQAPDVIDNESKESWVKQVVNKFQ
ncbi:uncharacterized protein LOC126778413 [Nymphalis io]|uniref:uncharacterized protein LOC126778413 n=1 Tax=Inachis io TaxID=171585 RepID=UPI0021681778|nr:uncharacterized protein LOC126778413 [Nymphalis io]